MLKSGKELHRRDLYLNRLIAFQDTEPVKIIELLWRGYDVAIGKVDNKEVDFIAANAKEKRYIQVTEPMNEPGHP